MAVSNEVVRFVVTGEPQPYRERTGYATRMGPDGRRVAILRNGHPIIGSFKPQHVGRYQDHIRRAAEDAMAGRPLFEGPVCLTVRAYMPIPATTLRKAERLLAERELMPHTKTPDLDNLIKAANDGLTGRVWRDDKQVVIYRDCLKVYSPRPRLEIEVRAITTIADVVPVVPEDDAAPPFVRFVQDSML